MNEQLQTALAEMLGKANSGIDAGATFLQAQLPDVIHQLLVWKATVSIIWFSLAVIALLGGLVLLYKWCWSSDSLDSDDKAFMTMICSIPGLIISIVIAENLEWLQILIAPKIYLIEYAVSLAK